MLWVRPGVFEVLASAFRRSSELISDDFPTLDRPRNAISGLTSASQSFLLNALLTNSDDVIFILNGPSGAFGYLCPCCHHPFDHGPSLCEDRLRIGYSSNKVFQVRQH